MELAAWRESEAQARDVPRSRVLKDDVLIELSLAAPRSVEALGNLRAFPRGMERSRAGGEILEAIERGLARDPKTLPKIERERRNGANVGATVELLKVLLRQVSEESGVAGKLIATVDDLEAIASSDKADVPALTGWRRKLFGERALELKHGRLALTVENGKVVTLEWRDAEEPGGRPEGDRLTAKGCSVHTSQIAARIPSPACWGRWRHRASKDARLSTGYGAGWGVARCYDARRLARTLPRTCGPSALLSTPHPSPSATPSPLRGEGGARRPPAGSMTCVNAVGLKGRLQGRAGSLRETDRSRAFSRA